MWSPQRRHSDSLMSQCFSKRKPSHRSQERQQVHSPTCYTLNMYTERGKGSLLEASQKQLSQYPSLEWHFPKLNVHAHHPRLLLHTDPGWAGLRAWACTCALARGSAPRTRTQVTRCCSFRDHTAQHGCRKHESHSWLPSVCVCITNYTLLLITPSKELIT